VPASCNVGHHGGRQAWPCSRSASCTRAPPAGSLDARTQPPCASAMAFTIARPSPAPPWRRLRARSDRRNRSKAWGRKSSGSPGRRRPRRSAAGRRLGGRAPAPRCLAARPATHCPAGCRWPGGAVGVEGGDQVGGRVQVEQRAAGPGHGRLDRSPKDAADWLGLGVDDRGALVAAGEQQQVFGQAAQPVGVLDRVGDRRRPGRVAVPVAVPAPARPAGSPAGCAARGWRRRPAAAPARARPAGGPGAGSWWPPARPSRPWSVAPPARRLGLDRRSRRPRGAAAPPGGARLRRAARNPPGEQHQRDPTGNKALADLLLGLLGGPVRCRPRPPSRGAGRRSAAPDLPPAASG
jgi:hypothetical protein